MNDTLLARAFYRSAYVKGRAETLQCFAYSYFWAVYFQIHLTKVNPVFSEKAACVRSHETLGFGRLRSVVAGVAGLQSHGVCMSKQRNCIQPAGSVISLTDDS